MGNAGAQLVGNTITQCGCMSGMGFEKSAQAVIQAGNIEPWPAKALVRERLENQAVLARSSPLRYVQVQDGLQHFKSHIGGKFRGLGKEEFVTVATNLIEVKKVNSKPEDIENLKLIFDSLDYDGNAELSVGEWAGGLTLFFKGTQEENTTALFELLDRDGSCTLNKQEMKEYVTPLVKAMTPPEAAGLRPLLIQHATDTIFSQVDVNKDGKCDAIEFSKWRQSHVLLDELVSIIEGQVYKIWLDRQNTPAGVQANVEEDPMFAVETKRSIFG